MIARSTRPRVVALILTGGRGLRMSRTSPSRLPKQFRTVLGIPLFVHCLNTYTCLSEVDAIYLVTHRAYARRYTSILARYQLTHRVTPIPGGATRLESVMNAMRHVTGKALVVLQNGVSATTPPALIRKCIRLARTRKAVTAYHPAFHTILRRCGNTLDSVLERADIGYACDPQVYDAAILRKALASAHRQGVTDAPTLHLVRQLGHMVAMVESDPSNLKVTTEPDLSATKHILARKRSRTHRTLTPI